ncbi:helix-turn-helix domain-containing protein [Thermostaphylospora chromogena]|uniref:Helix-turn-helix domain-containing protein n=1 Tax=Thermostaphylospora chromogena TaxID=35622 RepID=A0A1H1BXD4_9ACTN|nr:helix-turn-helix transcriptional regulator [Thermostaphylospora chromogena]SDQ56594.1 Helix-turn-helix domain-containing protein [Thermostaphylospora chromogena]
MTNRNVIAMPGSAQRPKALLRALLGKALRRIRLEQRRTLADVAGAARISLPYLSEVERGRKEASSEVLAALCDALDIELAELLTAVVRDLAAQRVPGSAAGRPAAWRATPAPAHRPDRAAAPPGRGDVVCLAA